MQNRHILITGAAGFIGAGLAGQIMAGTEDCTVIGIDNLNAYYDPELKKYRIGKLDSLSKGWGGSWEFIKGDISDRTFVDRLFGKFPFSIVVNLAAQAGVRYSIENPDAYIESNIIGFYHVLEACRKSQEKGPGVEHLVYASSSSVYGGSDKTPFSVRDKTDSPVSLYAATKKTDELLAHAYSKLYDLPATGLRFFTVYGPAGRPDMAYFGFTDKLRQGKTIEIFNHGDCRRDFTYIDDIVSGMMKVMQSPPERKRGADGLPVPPFKVYNIGNGHPVNLLEFVDILQQELIAAGVLAENYDFDRHKKLVAMQPGDVPVTYADTADLERDFGYKPNTDLRTGLRNFALWYQEYYGEVERKEGE